MAGLGDLFGRNGILEQLFLWGLMAEVVRAEFAPMFTALQQDVDAVHPLTALPADVIADAVARGLVSEAEGKAEAARNGIDAGRFATLLARARVRLDPADAAEAVLRSYLTEAEALAQVEPQGVDAQLLGTLVNLAGDAPGPQDLARALRRGLIPQAGRGPAATSYDQGIAESRLHNKWGPLLFDLSAELLSPPDAASAVVRNFMPWADALKLAEKQGVDAATFATMRNLAGDAPGPQQLAEALRRGLIAAEGTGETSTSFLQGIAEGRLADKWAPVIRGLAELWPSPVDAIDALVKGQIPADEGKALFVRLGGDPQFYDWLLSSAGEGPTPLEAAQMAARGLIGWDGTGPQATTFVQAVKESHYRDKWTDAYKGISQYVPAPSEVTTFLAHQLIDHDQAAALLAKHDMDAATIGLFIGEADYTAISDYRGLTQSAVTDMYYAHLISRDVAIGILGQLHVTEAAAGLLLDYADLRQVIDSIQRSVQRIATLFTSRKITTDTARQALVRLQIPTTSVEQILQTWELQAAASVKTLTETQIVDAWYYQVFNPDDQLANQAQALELLQAVGYTAYDAYVLLSLKAKGPLPNPPAEQIGAPPGAVIPGVT